MTSDQVQYLLAVVRGAWEREVVALGGDPERPTADEEQLLLLRELQVLGPEAVYGKAMWAAMQELDTSRGEDDDSAV